MKILLPSARRREDGVAVIVVLALLAILLIFVGANIRALYSLGRELKLVEQQQIKRLNARTASTHAVATQRFSADTNAVSVVGDVENSELR